MNEELLQLIKKKGYKDYDDFIKTNWDELSPFQKQVCETIGLKKQ